MKDREIKFTKTFEGDGTDFSAIHQAADFLTKYGFSSGSMQREAPIGLVKGVGVYIAKWRNLDSNDVKALDGVVRFPDGSPREGRAVIELYIDFQE